MALAGERIEPIVMSVLKYWDVATGAYVAVVGAPGATGPQGDRGDDGIGVVSGGLQGDWLVKQSNGDYDASWQVPAWVPRGPVGFVKGPPANWNSTTPGGAFMSLTADVVLDRWYLWSAHVPATQKTGGSAGGDYWLVNDTFGVWPSRRVYWEPHPGTNDPIYNSCAHVWKANKSGSVRIDIGMICNQNSVDIAAGSAEMSLVDIGTGVAGIPVP
jgi:hypothetical protein